MTQLEMAASTYRQAAGTLLMLNKQGVSIERIAKCFEATAKRLEGKMCVCDKPKAIGRPLCDECLAKEVTA